MLTFFGRSLFATMVIVLPLAAQATRVMVEVRLPDGSRAGPGITVTLTRDGVLTASPPTATTDRQSRARFDDIAEGRVVIVATHDGARGDWSGQIRGKNQNVQVTMEYGLISVAPTAPSAQDTNGDPAPATGETAVGVTNTTSVDPTPDPPRVAMQINEDAECMAHSSGEVTLTTAVTGPAPGEYRASESSSFAGSSWQPYTASPRFRLSDGAGQKRVYYQVRSPVDGTLLESNVASDVIERVVSNARASLAVNNGAGTTYSRTVTLNNTASFDGGGSNPRYIASESPQFTGAEWQPYGTAPAFTLSEGGGTKTVYFMATREVCGTIVGTPVVSDTIGLGEVSAVSVAVGTTEPAPAEPAPAPLPPRDFLFDFGGDQTVRPGTVATVGALAEVAKQNGFLHSATKIAGEGECSVVFSDDMVKKPALFLFATPAVERTTNVLVKSLICEYTLFAGRRLNAGWSVTQYAYPVLEHPYGETGKWMGNADIVRSNGLEHVVRINVPAYHCGLGTLEFCPSICGFRPSGASCWTQLAHYPFIDTKGPGEVTDWRDAVKQ